MRQYGDWLQSQGYRVDYLDYQSAPALENLAKNLERFQCGRMVFSDPVDRVLEGRLAGLSARTGLEISRLPSPGFLTSRGGWIEDFFREVRHYSPYLVLYRPAKTFRRPDPGRKTAGRKMELRP